ncbi:hypothetical protein NUU61_009464 [Penicillium alfredii]|uniref:Allergen Asp f 4 n=1 Tax=Penicillium alfredii TaxID=1506179 RepID=A0A9W9JXA4_9EURO|nr:uncharacterized protein NUU61_009464 [Penicillium alfredii]KAJ5084885.1 hypothetical protein NUU61_009464 [Penicillium alfredii]
MKWGISILLSIAAAGYSHAGSHGHHGHGHPVRHTEAMEPRDLAWDNTSHIPVDTVVELRTLTTTVFKDCASTDTLHVTTTVMEQTDPAPTQPELAQSNPPGSEPLTTILMTSTVTETATDKVEATTSPMSSNTTEGRHLEQTATLLNLGPNILPSLSPLPQLLPGSPNSPQPDEESLPANLDWTSHPEHDGFATKAFGGRTPPNDTDIHYRGNVGVPWGSNIISVGPAAVHRYKYVAQFTGSNTDPWTVTVWNKIGPDGKMNGWYGHSALTFTLAPGETRYVVFDEDSEGAWGAAPGSHGLPTDHWGGYSCTWGEFTFGDSENGGWSGWDVSAIQAQIAGDTVQGMRICQANGMGCSSISPQAKKIVNAYTKSKRKHNGIGGAAAPGPVRLRVQIDWKDNA